MSVTYTVVEHDGGWAYKVGNTFSETFPSRAAAESAAEIAAAEQRLPGDDAAISWEDDAGRWHDEAVLGTDRPKTAVTGEQSRPSASPPPPAFVSGHASRSASVRTPSQGSPLALLLLLGALGYLLAFAIERRSRR